MSKLVKRTGNEAPRPPDPTEDEINKALEPYGFTVGQSIKFSSTPGGQITSANKGTIVGVASDGSIAIRVLKNGGGRYLAADRIAPR